VTAAGGRDEKIHMNTLFQILAGLFWLLCLSAVAVATWHAFIQNRGGDE
jgi:hypothetical protein